MANDDRYGVRIYPLSSDVVLIKQTVKRRGSERYVVDTSLDGTHIEAHIDKSDRSAIADAVLCALRGKLDSKRRRKT